MATVHSPSGASLIGAPRCLCRHLRLEPHDLQMKQLLALLLFVPSLCLAQSVTLPYNPDANADSAIGAPDLLDFLPLFGGNFTPEPILVDGQTLEQYIRDQTSNFSKRIFDLEQKLSQNPSLSGKTAWGSQPGGTQYNWQRPPQQQTESAGAQYFGIASEASPDVIPPASRQQICGGPHPVRLGFPIKRRQAVGDLPVNDPLAGVPFHMFELGKFGFSSFMDGGSHG